MTASSPFLKNLIQAYKKIKPKIISRLAEFSKIHKGCDEKIFSELSYCILTANANALKCDEAIKELEQS